MAEENIPVNGEVGDVEEPAPEFGVKTTPEGAMVDLAGSDAETLLLPKSARIPYFFAYDNLMDQSIVARYVRGLIPAKIAVAPSYRLSWPFFYPPEGSGLPSLQRSSGSSVWGLLYDARGADFGKLDTHLNCPLRYHRRAVQVQDRGERRFSAFTYVLSLQDDTASRPSENYINHLIDTAKHRGLPDSWIEELEKLRQ
jgi:hypothetical protein